MHHPYLKSAFSEKFYSQPSSEIYGTINLGRSKPDFPFRVSLNSPAISAHKFYLLRNFTLATLERIRKAFVRAVAKVHWETERGDSKLCWLMMSGQLRREPNRMGKGENTIFLGVWPTYLNRLKKVMSAMSVIDWAVKNKFTMIIRTAKLYSLT